MSYIDEMERRLSEAQKNRLRSIWEPVVVAIQPSNTWCNLCVMPDGELRHYGRLFGQRIYLYSRDAGLSWCIGDIDDMSAMCSGLRMPSGKWINSFYVQGENGWQNGEMPTPPESATGWMAALSDEGPGGKVRWIEISGLNVRVPRFPLMLRKRNRVLITANLICDPQCPVVAYSDDEGESWRVSVLKSAPLHEAVWPHQSTRWQNGSCEASIVERSDGSLFLLARTSRDCLYMYESDDGGETWSEPQPTFFHSTLTMPTLLKMEDGKILLFFCNTQPLPEMNKEIVWPPLNADEKEGRSEDVFTNRDANHAAVSTDDGKTWQGFRELYLTSMRNEVDFRVKGGKGDGLDKSIHQFQALELPYGKVLLAFGQHSTARRMIIFDHRWLFEQKQEEDLHQGLSRLSTHVYYKSVSGNCRTYAGHCSWNRTSGAILLPDPDGNYEEALYLRANPDDRLLTPLQGVVWNFPASRRGIVIVKARPGEEGLTLTLTDRWFNPCDASVGALSPFQIRIYAAQCKADEWNELTAQWDEVGCDVFINSRLLTHLGLHCPMPTGLHYLILQSADRPSILSGSYIKSMRMEARD